MTSRPGQQIITMHILSNISRSKDDKTAKFGQLIEYNQRNIFLQKPCRKWGRETSSRSLFVFQKSSIWGESRWHAAYFQYISIFPNLWYIKTLDYWFRDILNFHFLKRSLGIVSPLHFAYDFLLNVFLIIYFINWLNFIAWLLLLLEILGNICIVLAC